MLKKQVQHDGEYSGELQIQDTRPRGQIPPGQFLRFFVRKRSFRTRPDCGRSKPRTSHFVIPAKAGTQFCGCCWVPAFAGMTKGKSATAMAKSAPHPFAVIQATASACRKWTIIQAGICPRGLAMRRVVHRLHANAGRWVKCPVLLVRSLTYHPRQSHSWPAQYP